MTWETFYLLCFFVGLGMSVITFFSGTLHAHLPSRLHLPHFGHGAHGVAHPHAGGAAHGASTGAHPCGQVSFFNFSSMMAFLCWFGGMGYLLTNYAHLWTALVLVLATLTGWAGAAIVFWVLAKFLMGHERPLNAEDFEMAGVMATVSSGVRAHGTGEIVFLQAGTRRACGARSDAGAAIPRGSEVVVTSFSKGIAYVRPWAQFADENLVHISDDDLAGAGDHFQHGEDLQKADGAKDLI